MVANLRQNLLRGGVGEDTIALLSQDDAAASRDEKHHPPSTILDKNEDGGVRLGGSPQSPAARQTVTKRAPAGSGHGGYFGSGGGNRPHQDTQDWADADAVADDASYSLDALADGFGAPAPTSLHNSRPQFDRQCSRTVQLLNLPEGATHADIAAVVRGGLLLDIFVRAHERSATVSFLHGADAKSFCDHVKRHDLYIKNKRVEIRWNERQFILTNHVASKIGIGASRNLVIRRCDSRLTEEAVREDLDHIHNLVVIKVEFIGGSCYISTNSVHNAMFARTCMMSRLRYKGSKIDWDVDECAQPFNPIPVPKPRKEAAPLKKAPSSMANRFQLLNLDDDDGDDDEITSTFRRTKNSVDIAA